MQQHPYIHAGKLRKYDLPSIDDLRKRYTYDPGTGQIIGQKGHPIGTLDRVNGYVQISYRRRGTQMHFRRSRLAWALVHGYWPHLVDHINRDRADDRLANLREVSSRENMLNRSDRTGPPKMIRRQKPGWVTQSTKRGKLEGVYRRHFCDAWKVRKAWLADAIAADVAQKAKRESQFAT